MKHLIFAMLFCLVAPVAQAQNFDSLPEPETDTPAPPPATAAPEAKGCGDDPRLVNIAELMSGSAKVSPPLTLAPETFLTLDQEVLDTLGGQMTVCPNNPVLKSGKPMKKVAINFEPLWDQIRKAAINNDFEKVKTLATSFVVNPKEPKDIPPLFSRIDMDEKRLKDLLAALGIQERVNELPLEADIFIALGGKSTAKTDAYFLDNGDHFNETNREKLASKGILLSGIRYICTFSATNDTFRRVASSKLHALGLNPVAIF